MVKNIPNKNEYRVNSNVAIITDANLVRAAVSFCAYLSVSVLRKKQGLLHINDVCHVAEVWSCTEMNKNVVCCTRALLKADLFPVMSRKIPVRQVQVIHGESSLWHLKGDCDTETNCMSPCCHFYRRNSRTWKVHPGGSKYTNLLRIWEKSQYGRQEVYLFGIITFKI